MKALLFFLPIFTLLVTTSLGNAWDTTCEDLFLVKLNLSEAKEIAGPLASLLATGSLQHLNEKSIHTLKGFYKKLGLTGDITDFEQQKIMFGEIEKKYPEVLESLKNRNATATLLMNSKPNSNNRSRDFHRTSYRDWAGWETKWGAQILEDNDPAFFDPVYIRKLVKHSKVGAVGIFQADMQPIEDFKNAWARLFPESNIIQFFISGSEANNSVFELARQALKAKARTNRVQKKWTPDKDFSQLQPQVITFEGDYHGVSGIVHEVRSFGSPYKLPRASYRIDAAADLQRGELSTLQELLTRRELTAKEKKILQKIESYFNDPDSPVGAVLLEPMSFELEGKISVHSRIYLLELRKLCDKYNIPLVADEILTGGGRTGKMFAFEHFEGFRPDFITFGKAFQISGIARVWPTQNSFAEDFQTPGTTFQGFAEPLLKGAQVLRAIYERDLLQNVTSMGNYAREEFKKVFENSNYPRPVEGVGTLISIGGRRILLPLSITKEQIDDAVLDAQYLP